MIAFNFVSEEEAKEFKAVVDEKLVVRRRREGIFNKLLLILRIILLTICKQLFNQFLVM